MQYIYLHVLKCPQFTEVFVVLKQLQQRIASMYCTEILRSYLCVSNTLCAELTKTSPFLPAYQVLFAALYKRVVILFAKIYTILICLLEGVHFVCLFTHNNSKYTRGISMKFHGNLLA